MSMKYDPKYDFSNKGVDWAEYQREVRIRTDAIWERQKLKDYFRLFYKIFYWDPKTENYYVTMPEHSDYNSPDNWRFRPHAGYTPTGKSDSFERPFGLEFSGRTVTLNQSDTYRNKNAICYYRFRAYKKCEGNPIYTRMIEIDNPDGSPETLNMSCYQEMTDMLQYCSHVQINWLADLWHHMELNNDPTVFGTNDEIGMMIDEFDNSDFKVYSY